MAPVKGNGKEYVRRFRSSICGEWIIRRPLKVGIIKVHVSETVTSRRQVDQPPTCTDKRRNPVYQDKVTQVIRAELRLKAIRRMAKRCGHYSCVCDYRVEGFAFGEQSIGAGAHALQIGEIQSN
jgi:hypothetical protein